MFLDYDGTLSPIVGDPDRAFLSNEVRNYLALKYFYLHKFVAVFTCKQFAFQMRYAVRNVAKYFPTAIISGRSRDKVDTKVSL